MSSPVRFRLYQPIVKSLNQAWTVAMGALLLAMALSTITSAQMVMDVDHEMEAARRTKQPAYDIVSCGKNGQQSLPAGDYNSDLHVGRAVRSRWNSGWRNL